ncbi:MAG: LEA type 2 family protein [Solirubrobacterales bacterium]
MNRPAPGRFSAARALIVTITLAGLLGSVVAYAQTRAGAHRGQGGPGRNAAGTGRSVRPPRPRLIEVPAAPAIGAQAQFRFHVTPRHPGAGGGPGPAGPPPRQWRRFECSLDGGAWEGCDSPRLLTRLEPGEHAFAARALSPGGRAGPAVYHAWTQLAAQRFSIEPLSAPPADLMPGAPPQPLPVRIANPNPAPIEVTGVTVSIAPDPSGCPAQPNFDLRPAGITPADSLRVPAGTSVTLPSPTVEAPAIALRELPFDQNACQGIELPLVFSGEARG